MKWVHNKEREGNRKERGGERENTHPPPPSAANLAKVTLTLAKLCKRWRARLLSPKIFLNYSL